MKENHTDPTASKPSLEDLEQLKSLSFQPQWSSPPKGKSSDRGAFAPRENRGVRSGGAPQTRKDRRPPRENQPKESRPRTVRPEQPSRYEPIVSISIYPEDEPFGILTQSIRSTLKVYELFELTRLILEKPDRMVVVLHPLKEGGELFVSLPDRQVFRDSEAAWKHALKLEVERNYVREEIETEPPKGNFTTVLRCGKTGRYLPPRSHHKFGALLAEHQREHCPKLSPQAVEKSLEPVSDPEAVQEWIQSMSRKVVYRPKSVAEKEETQTYEGLDGLLAHLRMQDRSQWVETTVQVRVSGKTMAEAVDPELRSSFLSYIEWQKRFPLETSNNVRMKLRKNRFYLFKKGKKGISYVACVRRCPRPAGAVFSDSVTRILTILEAQGEIPGSKLPGLLYPDRVDENGKVELETDEKKQLLNDLKWLKSEGYLYEYSDGTLEIQPVETKKELKPKPAKMETAKEETEADLEEITEEKSSNEEG